jgi:DNA invertase Pin-like site-specific DNA recombinase
MRKIAYVRVSTADQRHDRQIEGLAVTCDEVHVETLSACAAKRPVYERVLRRLKPGDMLVVWDLDRAFRSVVDALTEAEKLRQRASTSRSPISGSTRQRPPGCWPTPSWPPTASSSGG